MSITREMSITRTGSLSMANIEHCSVGGNAVVCVLCEQVQQWRAAGKEPYAYSFRRTHLAAQLQAEYADLPAGEVRSVYAKWAPKPSVTMLRFVIHPRLIS